MPSRQRFEDAPTPVTETYDPTLGYDDMFDAYNKAQAKAEGQRRIQACIDKYDQIAEEQEDEWTEDDIITRIDAVSIASPSAKPLRPPPIILPNRCHSL